MKCVIPGPNVKVFGRAIHSLAKIGEELYLEPLEHGLALRTVNSSRSAYACFIFAPSFFLDYTDGRSCTSSDSEEDVLKFKLNMKSCLTVFRSLSTLDKTVDKCKIKLDEEEARVVFLMYCRHGIVKTHNLAFIECETLQAVFSKEFSPNILTAQTRLLCDAVMNFQTNQDEVSLIVDPLKTRLKNYMEDDADPQKAIHTELSLESEEFETYQVGVDCEVTFCLKELRAILGFSEPNNLPISIHFESSGKPIVFSMDSDPSFEATFVLATLADKNSQASCSQLSQAQRPSQRISRHNSGSNLHTSHTRQGAEPVRPLKVEPKDTPMKDVNDEQQTETDMPTSRFKKHINRHKKSMSARLEAAFQDLTKEDAPNPKQKPANHVIPKELEPTNHQPADRDGCGDMTAASRAVSAMTTMLEDEDDDDMPCSPVIPVQVSIQGQTSKERVSEPRKPLSLMVGEDSTTEDDDSLPGTPPSKKFKAMFAGLSQSTTAGSQVSRTVLAEDTDEDD